MTVEIETAVKIPSFNQENRRLLPENGFVIVELTGKSLRELIENGDLPISEYKVNPDLIPDYVLDERSRVSEVAYDLKNLFILHSNKTSYEDQRRMIDEETKTIRESGVKNIEAYMVSFSDAAEIAAIELDRKRRIFGRKFVSDEFTRYPWIRTSTEIDSSTSVIIGCDDLDIPEGIFNRAPEGEFRGIHVQTFPKVNEKHAGLLVMRVFVPAL